MCKQTPKRVRDSSTFIIDSKQAGVLHPYDLAADDVPGASESSTKVRFYHVSNDDSNNLIISTEVTPTRDNIGKS